MRRPRSQIIIIACATALVCAGYVTLSGNSAEKADAPKTAAAAHHLELKAPQPSAEEPSRATTPRADSAPPAPTAGVKEGRQQRLERLLHSAKPAERLQAFKELLRCASEQREAPSIAQEDPSNAGKNYLIMNQACDGVTASMLAARHKVIEDLAKAGEPGAAALYIAETPDGVPRFKAAKDPNYQAWHEAALTQLEAAARRGDAEAVLEAAAIYQDIPGQELASLKYRAAALEFSKKQLPAALIDGQLERLSSIYIQKKGLNAQEVNQAITSGRAFGKTLVKPATIE